MSNIFEKILCTTETNASSTPVSAANHGSGSGEHLLCGSAADNGSVTNLSARSPHSAKADLLSFMSKKKPDLLSFMRQNSPKACTQKCSSSSTLEVDESKETAGGVCDPFPATVASIDDEDSSSVSSESSCTSQICTPAVAASRTEGLDELGALEISAYPGIHQFLADEYGANVDLDAITVATLGEQGATEDTPAKLDSSQDDDRELSVSANAASLKRTAAMTSLDQRTKSLESHGKRQSDPVAHKYDAAIGDFNCLNGLLLPNDYFPYPKRPRVEASTSKIEFCASQFTSSYNKWKSTVSVPTDLVNKLPKPILQPRLPPELADNSVGSQILKSTLNITFKKAATTKAELRFSALSKEPTTENFPRNQDRVVSPECNANTKRPPVKLILKTSASDSKLKKYVIVSCSNSARCELSRQPRDDSDSDSCSRGGTGNNLLSGLPGSVQTQGLGQSQTAQPNGSQKNGSNHNGKEKGQTLCFCAMQPIVRLKRERTLEVGSNKSPANPDCHLFFTSENWQSLQQAFRTVCTSQCCAKSTTAKKDTVSETETHSPVQSAPSTPAKHVPKNSPCKNASKASPAKAALKASPVKDALKAFPGQDAANVSPTHGAAKVVPKAFSAKVAPNAPRVEETPKAPKNDTPKARAQDSLNISPDSDSLTTSPYEDAQMTSEMKNRGKHVFPAAHALKNQSSVVCSKKSAGSEAEHRSKVALELRRLNDSADFCAFSNIPNRREQQKVAKLYRSLVRHSNSNSYSRNNGFRNCVTTPTVTLKSKNDSKGRNCGRRRITKHQRKTYKAMRSRIRLSCKQLRVLKSSVTQNITDSLQNANSNNKPASAEHKYAVPSGLHPLLAACFDKESGMPITDHFGRSPLHIAMLCDDKDGLGFVVDLFKREGNIDCKDNEGATPLHTACASGNVKGAEMLLQAGASVNERGGEAGNTPLHEAVAQENLRIVQALADYGADVTCLNYKNETVLDFKTSAEVSALLTELHEASVASMPNPDSEILHSDRRLPTVYAVYSEGAPCGLRRYALQSDLCASLGISKEYFSVHHKPNMKVCTVNNAAFASSIISPDLQASFERSALCTHTSDLVEVDDYFTRLFSTFRSAEDVKCVKSSSVSSLKVKDIYSLTAKAASSETDEMTDEDFVDDDECQIRTDDVREMNRSLRNSRSRNSRRQKRRKQKRTAHHSSPPTSCFHTYAKDTGQVQNLKTGNQQSCLKNTPSQQDIQKQQLRPSNFMPFNSNLSAERDDEHSDHIDIADGTDDESISVNEHYEMEFNLGDEIRVPQLNLESKSRRKTHPLLTNSSGRVDTSDGTSLRTNTGANGPTSSIKAQIATPLPVGGKAKCLSVAVSRASAVDTGGRVRGGTAKAARASAKYQSEPPSTASATVFPTARVNQSPLITVGCQLGSAATEPSGGADSSLKVLVLQRSALTPVLNEGSSFVTVKHQTISTPTIRRQSELGGETHLGAVYLASGKAEAAQKPVGKLSLPPQLTPAPTAVAEKSGQTVSL